MVAGYSSSWEVGIMIHSASQVFGLAGLILSFAGSATAAAGTFLNRHNIEEVSGTYWGENEHLRRALQRQSRAVLTGFGLLALGTVLQIAAMFAPG